MLKKCSVMILSLGFVVNAFADIPDQCPAANAFVFNSGTWTFVDQSLNTSWTIISPTLDSSGLSTMRDVAAVQAKVTTAYWLTYGTLESGIKEVTCTYALSGYDPLIVQSKILSNYTFANKNMEGGFHKDGQFTYTCITNADTLNKCNWGNRIVSFCPPGKKKCELLHQQ